jgi:uncharacterized protein YxeA
MNNNTRWVVIAAVAVVIGAAGFVAGKASTAGNTASVQESAEAFVSSLVSGDVDATYDQASKAYQARNTKEYVKSVADSLKSDNPVIENEEVFFGSGDQKDQAIYLNTVDNLPRSDINSTKGNFVIRLVKEGGEWKVDSSQVY